MAMMALEQNITSSGLNHSLPELVKFHVSIATHQ